MQCFATSVSHSVPPGVIQANRDLYICPTSPARHNSNGNATPIVSSVDQLKLPLKLPKAEKPPEARDIKIFYDTLEGKVSILVSPGDK